MNKKQIKRALKTAWSGLGVALMAVIGTVLAFGLLFLALVYIPKLTLASSQTNA